jgi:hypothetical protein
VSEVADNLQVGQWALVTKSYDGRLRPDVVQIAALTPKLVKWPLWGNRFRQAPRLDVIAAFAEQKDAERLRDTLAGIRGERDRRIAAAHSASAEAADMAISTALSTLHADPA